MSELDKDFEETASLINRKLKEAATALREANRLADEAGLPGLFFSQFTREDMQYRNKYADNPLSEDDLEEKMDEMQEKLEHIDVSDIESAMSGAGWNTSSSYC